MKKMFSIVLMLSITPLFSGCAVFDKLDTETTEFKAKKTKLEREIELLRLERRKLLLQNSLDRLDAEPLPGESDASLDAPEKCEDHGNK